LHYALNLFAFGTFSPVSTRSAPTFFPLAGQPYLGPKTLLHTLHELMLHTSTNKKNSLVNELVFIVVSCFPLQRYKLRNIIPMLQANRRRFDE